MRRHVISWAILYVATLLLGSVLHGFGRLADPGEWTAAAVGVTIVYVGHHSIRKMLKQKGLP